MVELKQELPAPKTPNPPKTLNNPVPYKTKPSTLQLLTTPNLRARILGKVVLISRTPGKGLRAHKVLHAFCLPAVSSGIRSGLKSVLAARNVQARNPEPHVSCRKQLEVSEGTDADGELWEFPKSSVWGSGCIDFGVLDKKHSTLCGVLAFGK